MKKLFLLILFVVSFSFLNTSCSGGHIPAAVCDYGQIVCDISQTACRNIPGVPPSICDYLDLACYNLEVLCSTDPESEQYKSALISLELINERLTEYQAAQK